MSLLDCLLDLFHTERMKRKLSKLLKILNHFTVKVGTKVLFTEVSVLIQFSREERKGGKLICPGCFNCSPVNVAIVAFPKAQAERVEVEFTSAVVAQELPLVFILSQGETGIGILRQKLSCAVPPEC